MQKKKKDIHAVVLSSTEVPENVREQKETERTTKEFIRFGTDNLFPQALAGLYRKSPNLRAIINSITIFTVGGGFKVSEDNKEGDDWLRSVNADGEDLMDVYDRSMTDKGVIGNRYLLLSTDSVIGNASFLNVDHFQSVKCRLKKVKPGDEQMILVHPDWSRFDSHKKLLKEFPIYPNFMEMDGAFRSMVHIKEYEPDFDHYGIASYVAAMDAAAIAYKTNKWNVSRLDNSFQTSGVLLVDGDMSDKDAKTLQQDIKDNLIGEGNQGKLLTIIKKLGGESTSFTPINSNTEGDWLSLHTQSDNDLIMALNWKKSLAGISENTGFETDRIINDYQVVLNTNILKEQNNFIRRVQKWHDDLGTGIDLTDLFIDNRPPINLLTKLSADKYTQIWEARKMAGLEYDMEDPLQMKYVETVKEKDNDSTDNANGSN